MRLHAVCYYRSKSEEWTDKWRNEDYSALKLVKAVKGLDFNGTCQITQGGTSHTIGNTAEGRDKAITIAARAIAGAIAKAGYQTAAIVPIPSSDHTDPTSMFTGRRLSEAIQQAHPPFTSTPILYFDQALPKSRGGGGSRNPWTIKGHLRSVVCDLPQPLVLVDDVCTSGGHLIAAAQYIADQGPLVEDAFVVGRTAWQRPDSMFSVVTETLDTTDPFGALDF